MTLIDLKASPFVSNIQSTGENKCFLSGWKHWAWFHTPPQVQGRIYLHKIYIFWWISNNEKKNHLGPRNSTRVRRVRALAHTQLQTSSGYGPSCRPDEALLQSLNACPQPNSKSEPKLKTGPSSTRTSKSRRNSGLRLEAWGPTPNFHTGWDVQGLAWARKSCTRTIRVQVTVTFIRSTQTQSTY